MTTFTIENNPASMNTVFLEVTGKNLDLEFCMGLIYCNFTCTPENYCYLPQMRFWFAWAVLDS